MGSKLLDMRQWGLASLDEDMAHLKHKDGHEMHVSIKHLPKLQQEQIKRIKKADGGPVLNPDESKKFELGFDPSKKPQPAPPQPAPPQPKPPGYKKGGKVDDGLNQEELDHARELGDERTYDKSNDTGLFSPTAGEPEPQLKDDQSTPASSPSIVIHNHAPAQPSVGSQIPSVPDQAITQSGGQPPAQQAPAPQAPPFSPEQAQQGQVGASEDIVKQQQDLKDTIQNNISDMQKHTDEFAAHLQSNPINPRAYQESQSSGQKTNTAIGLILGGFGGMGKGNAALDFLNRQIDRDIDSQKANMEREKNIFGAYQHLYENQAVATNLTKASLLDIYDSKMRLSALKIGTPQAMNNYQAFNKEVQAQKGQLLQAAAVAKTQGPQGEITPLLKPGANLRQAQFNPLNTKYLPEITKQFTQAQMADKVLGQLPEIFDQMQVARGAGHYAADVVHHIPLVGGAIEQGVRAGSPKAQQFETAKSRLFSEIGNAVGSSVNSTQIQKIIDDNSLTEIDKPEDIKRKMHNIEMFIKNSIPRSLLGEYLAE